MKDPSRLSEFFKPTFDTHCFSEQICCHLHNGGYVLFDRASQKTVPCPFSAILVPKATLVKTPTLSLPPLNCAGAQSSQCSLREFAKSSPCERCRTRQTPLNLTKANSDTVQAGSNLPQTQASIPIAEKLWLLHQDTPS